MHVEIVAELAQGLEGQPRLVYADDLATADYKHYEHPLSDPAVVCRRALKRDVAANAPIHAGDID